MPKPKNKKKRGNNIPTTRVSVVVVQDSKILLVKHRKGTRQYWVLPGGRLEYGETFQECGIRELKEETGLEVEVQDFLFLSEAIAPDRSRHIVNIYLKGKVTGGTMKLGSEPVLAGVDFLPLAELGKITLFPPIAQAIINSLPNGSAGGIEYLGNLWV
ncbi:MAG: NUDIX hydrolase [Candidatus Melainabacteria bacterium]|nr:MAG: NUDIX hydrolase [Candidatus Melainabacteria bacterium]